MLTNNARFLVRWRVASVSRKDRVDFGATTTCKRAVRWKSSSVHAYRDPTDYDRLIDASLLLEQAGRLDSNHDFGKLRERASGKGISNFETSPP